MVEKRYASGVGPQVCDADMADIAAQPFSTGKTFFIPASDFDIGEHVVDNSSTHIQFMLSFGRAGLFFRATPDTARHLIEAIERSIAGVERSVAAQANAAIEKARGK